MREFAAGCLQSLLGRVAAECDRARAAPDEDAVHDLRVSIRRTREALRVFRGLFRRKQARRLSRRLRAVMRRAGEVRNRDIAMALVRESAVEGWQQESNELSRERSAAVEGLAESLHELGALAPPELAPNPSPRWDAREGPAANARRLLPRLAAAYWKAGQEAAQPGVPWERMHAFRIATKHLRYTLELFAPLYGRALTKKFEVLRRVQNSLGRINDFETAKNLGPARRLAAHAGWISDRQSEERTAFERLWEAEFAASRGGLDWERYLRRYAREAGRRAG